jgi:uncharacterized DUF497 family protein
MMKVSFAWDLNKNKINSDKHGVSFEEARSVFIDQNAIEYYDEDHSLNEERFLMLGMSYKFRLLLVSYTTIKHNSSISIRIISARKATKSEQINYKG